MSEKIETAADRRKKRRTHILIDRYRDTLRHIYIYIYIYMCIYIYIVREREREG